MSKPKATKNRPTLWVHIGAGKTGTSSIQETFREQLDAFRQRGCWYLGLALEHAPEKLWSWQRRGEGEALFSLPQDTAVAQFAKAVGAALDGAAAEGAKQVVWSNESLLDRGAHLISPLQALAAQGWDVRIIAYVRRHDAWARSAYAQWGIKHKTYPGPVWDFARWKDHRRIEFAPSLDPWHAAFGPRMNIRNMDTSGDVVTDFCGFVGVSLAGLRPIRAYEMPSGEELVLRALFNNRVEDKALPMEYSRAVGNMDPVYDTTLADLLGRLLPSEDDLRRVAQDAGEDRRRVDALLAASGQPPMQTSPLPPRPVTVNDSRVLAALCQIVLEQANRLRKLERNVERLHPQDAVCDEFSGASPLVREAMTRHPDLAAGLSEEAGVRLVQAVHDEILRMLADAEEGPLDIPGLGRFIVRRIENEGPAGSAVAKRIIFRPAVRRPRGNG